MTSVAAIASIAILLAASSIGCVADRTPGEGTSLEGAGSHAFTYSIIETTLDTAKVLSQVEAHAIPEMVEAGATLYSVWLPTELPGEAPFVGLSDSQLGLMLAWPEDRARGELLGSTLGALDGVGSVTTRTLDPIYLAEGLHVPTGRGFYVHREERYRPDDVEEAVRLSKEAWETFEPTIGARVIGLFRERLDSADVAKLVRIVWYRSREAWVESRNFQQDPESRQRFAKRSRLQLEGSRVAIATDRAAP